MCSILANTYSRLTRGSYLFLPCCYVNGCGVTAVITISLVGVRIPLDHMDVVIGTLFSFLPSDYCMHAFESYEALNTVELRTKCGRDLLAACVLNINLQSISISAFQLLCQARSQTLYSNTIPTRFEPPQLNNNGTLYTKHYPSLGAALWLGYHVAANDASTGFNSLSRFR